MSDDDSLRRVVAVERLRELEDVLRRLAVEATLRKSTDPERLHGLVVLMERQLCACYDALGGSPSGVLAELLEDPADD